jgi:biotin carboxylase
VKTIMILGAGIMQLPGIRIAQRNGWKTVVVDGNASALGREMGDRFEVVDLKDRDGLCALARRIQADGGLDGVFTAGTDFSSSVAWVAEKLGLPGLSFATAMKATDKCLMRDAFVQAGVPSPRYACWAGKGDPLSALGEGLDFPLVVKPVDNMGARGVRRVEGRAELADACRSALPLSRTGKVIIEQFMEGPELSLDAVVYQGKVTVCGVADRHIRFPPSFVEMGHTMPTELDSRTVARIEAVFTEGVHALGIDNGAAKGDIKLTAEGPMVGEIAARLSGGYMSGWTFPLASGVEVTGAALNIAMGLLPGELSPRWHRTCAERALISVPGVVARVEGEQAARAVPGVEDIFLRVCAGTEVVFPTNNVEKCGNVIAVGVDRDEAVRRAADALSQMCIRLKPGVERTTRWLFHETGNDAFSGPLFPAAGGLPRFRGNPSEVDPDGPIMVTDAGNAAASGSWYDTPLSQAVSAALRLGGGVMTAPSGAGPALGSLFWLALARGGTQGAVYLLDTIRDAARARTLAELLERL